MENGTNFNQIFNKVINGKLRIKSAYLNEVSCCLILFTNTYKWLSVNNVKPSWGETGVSLSLAETDFNLCFYLIKKN